MNEKLQTINMCIRTYKNLYGHQPTIAEMTRMLDVSYLQLITMILGERVA